MKAEINEINDQLAHACQTREAACCCKGKVFLPKDELFEIQKWLTVNQADMLPDFESRLEHYETFSLYDQKERCQFLDNDNLCVLHESKTKPTECYWWPLHVYQGQDESLDIRVSTTCCDAYKHIPSDSSLVDDVEAGVERLGKEIFFDFRKAFPGTLPGKNVIRTIY